MPAFFLGMILVCLFAALLVALSDLAVDLASTWLDPRVKYS